MGWIILASIILGVAESVSSAIHTTKNTKALQNKYGNTLKAMQKDSQLMAELETAYRNRDSQLIQNLLNASPFSSDVSKMREDLAKVRQDQKNLAKQKVSTAEEQAKINKEYSEDSNKVQSSGSIIVDLVRGGIGNDSEKEYTGSGYTTKDLEEVNKLW